MRLNLQQEITVYRGDDADEGYYIAHDEAGIQLAWFNGQEVIIPWHKIDYVEIGDGAPS